jgi:hypothetical protein
LAGGSKQHVVVAAQMLLDKSCPFAAVADQNRAAQRAGSNLVRTFRLTQPIVDRSGLVAIARGDEMLRATQQTLVHVEHAFRRRMVQARDQNLRRRRIANLAQRPHSGPHRLGAHLAIHEHFHQRLYRLGVAPDADAGYHADQRPAAELAERIAKGLVDRRIGDRLSA